jgi:ribosomal protein L11 methyltransferase
LIIEPGMAFGTGTHETTRGCLELMAHACEAAGLKRGSAKASAAHVLDFGCGSGILAIGLKKLGISHVYGIDIDPLAIDATNENARRNSVEVAAMLESEGLPKLDGIVANILKNTLLEFAPRFQSWLKPGGFLILSGLLVEQEKTILEHYAALGFETKERLENNNWITLRLIRSKRD